MKILPSDIVFWTKNLVERPLFVEVEIRAISNSLRSIGSLSGIKDFLGNISEAIMLTTIDGEVVASDVVRKLADAVRKNTHLVVGLSRHF
jgi:hypothetical protein